MKYRKIMALIFIVVLTGCGLTIRQKEAVSGFAKSSGGIGAFAANELPYLRNAVIDMNISEIALNSEMLDANGKPKHKNLDESLDYERIQVRIKAANALTGYGELLLVLAQETDADNMKNASDKFVDSLKAMPDNYKKLNDEQLAGIGKIVNEIGGLWLDHKKACAVKKIVKNSKESVDEICTLLINDFDVTTPNIAYEVDIAQTRLIAKAHSRLIDSKELSIADKLVAVQGYHKAEEVRLHEKLVLEKAVTTLKALKAAHSELVLAVENDSLTLKDIQASAKEFKGLSDALKTLATK